MWLLSVGNLLRAGWPSARLGEIPHLRVTEVPMADIGNSISWRSVRFAGDRCDRLAYRDHDGVWNGSWVSAGDIERVQRCHLG